MTGHIDLIVTALERSNLKAVLRQDNREAWRQAWEALPYQPVNYAEPMIDYQHAYLRGTGWELNDVSLVLLNDGRPCGLWPLTLGGPQGKPRITSTGSAVFAPVFISGLSQSTVKAICGRAIVFLQKLAEHFAHENVLVEQAAEPGALANQATKWHQKLMACDAAVTVRHDLYVDLCPPLPEIRSSFRKSYKPLISSGLKSWQVSLLDQNSVHASDWAEFKRLHFDVAGGRTRDDETWDAQLAMIYAGHAFLIELRDPSSQCIVGAGFFQHSRDEGLYAVAAYDRSLFDKPLGHVVQQIAIEKLKSLGVRWYRIGERFYPQDRPKPSDKEMTIAAFKQGFASHMFCRFTFQLPQMLGVESVDGAA